MPKGKLSEPKWIKCTCQFCNKEFEFYQTTSNKRKACYDCLPEGHSNDASLIRRLVKNKIVQLKGNKCAVCGKTYPNAVYDLHHLNSEDKEFNLGNKTSTVKLDKVLAEADKCILVCANCHRMIHSGDVQIDARNGVE